jgi:type VI protein secretion system component Hcp
MRTYLKIDGVESEIRDLSIDFNRSIDENGKVVTRVQRGIISLSKDAIYDRGNMIKWMADQDLLKEGEITIYEDDVKSKKFQVIKFQNGKIFDWSVSYSREGAANVYESFAISAEKIDIDGAAFDFQWPENM